ncbi:MAG: hypothetical protein HLUCCA08_06570 [Rhodobacteraceae bacterium HLUCCA08]|nr:MAG: hypothetical protein HLUCCA08_06570 [Rhodobacteraceae bacterium HLUCCA08]
MTIQDCVAVTGTTPDQTMRHVVQDLIGALADLPVHARDEIMIGVSHSLLEMIAYEGRAGLSAQLRGEMITLAARLQALQPDLAA